MTMGRLRRNVFAVACLAALSTRCGSTPPANYYTLEPTAAPDGTPAASFGVAIDPVSVPAAVDRPQFVVLLAPNQVALSEFERWASPLQDEVARVVAADLCALLGTPRVSAASLPQSDAAYQVAIDIQRFDSILGEAAILEAFWSVRTVATSQIRSGRTVVREAAQGPGFGPLAGAHSRALAQLSRDVAAAIRAAAADKPP